MPAAKALPENSREKTSSNIHRVRIDHYLRPYF